MKETNEKENVIVPLLQTNPAISPFHAIISNERNYSIDIPQEESKEFIEIV